MTLAAALKVLGRWWMLVALTTAMGGAVGLGASASITREYESEARILVGSLTNDSYDTQLAWHELAATYAGVATTTPVLEAVAAEVGAAGSHTVAERVEVRAPLNERFVIVTARAPSPAEAEQLADALAAKIVDFGRLDPNEESLATIVQSGTGEAGFDRRIVVNALVGGVLGFAVGIGFALFLSARRV